MIASVRYLPALKHVLCRLRVPAALSRGGARRANTTREPRATRYALRPRANGQGARERPRRQAFLVCGNPIVSRARSSRGRGRLAGAVQGLDSAVFVS